MGIWLTAVSNHFLRSFILRRSRPFLHSSRAHFSSSGLSSPDHHRYHEHDTGIVSGRRGFSTGGSSWVVPGAQRREAARAVQRVLESDSDSDHDTLPPQVVGMDFPGGRVSFTTEMSFIPEAEHQRVPCFRLLDHHGFLLPSSIPNTQVSKEMSVKMYKNMVTLQVMDTVLYEAQRQGRISFYVTSNGEEAINLASAAALSPEDVIFAQYREPGVLLWRGFTLQEFVNQCFGNSADYGKGRQMPIHYGSQKLNYFTISSPLATQLPQAVGAAYSLKMDKKDACVVAYFGDGTTSEGDFHAGMNFAAVLEAPVVFVCRNNGWAISTPTTEQFRSDGVVVKGRGYGIRSIRVDGNDTLAVYNVIKSAREMAIREQRPILVEALTYRVGHHSTSDDSTKYRPSAEIEQWKMARDPLARFRCFIERNGWWAEEDESQLRSNIKKQMIEAIQAAERMQKPGLSELFKDVYDQPTKELAEQERLVRECAERHPKDYPSDVPL